MTQAEFTEDEERIRNDAMDFARRHKREIARKLTDRSIFLPETNPVLAWKFVLAREAGEGRNVPVGRFIDQYFAARDVVNSLKREFGTEIMVDLLVKPNDSVDKLYKAGIDQIDNHVGEKYARDELGRILEGIRE